jgi:hypothetical protein
VAQAGVGPVAKAEYLMLAIGLAGMDGDPLDPRLDVLVDFFRARARIAVRSEDPRKRWQQAALRIVLYELEIKLV